MAGTEFDTARTVVKYARELTSRDTTVTNNVNVYFRLYNYRKTSAPRARILKKKYFVSTRSRFKKEETMIAREK